MGKKLHVGSLSYGTSEDSLKSYFSQCGNVESANVIIDKATGRSRGFGFVEMSNDEEAQKAITSLNGTELDGRKITVNEARPMEPRGPRRDGGGGGRSFNRSDRGGFGGGFNRDNRSDRSW